MAEKNPYNSSGDNEAFKAALEARNIRNGLSRSNGQHPSKKGGENPYKAMFEREKANRDPHEEMAQMLIRNAAGYEAVGNPDKAVAEYGQDAIAELLNPQEMPQYTAVEGSPYDAISAALEDPRNDVYDAIRAHMVAGASISNLPGSDIYTLTWEGEPEMNITEHGQIVPPHQL